MLKISIAIPLLTACVILFACSPAEKTTAPDEQAASTGNFIDPHTDNLNVLFDCLEKEGVTLISAHRGGMYPRFPENALETMRYLVSEIPVIMEIDVATSKDGVLFLMHDDTLDRTSTGTGVAADKSWDYLSTLKLVDNDGTATSFPIPKFSDVLEWSEGKTILQIDFKRSTRFEDVVSEVKRQHATGRIIYIAYSLGQAEKLHRLHKEAMISVTLDDPSDLDELQRSSLPETSVLGWTGNVRPDGQVFDQLNAEKIEVIFGTLGGRNSIDNQIIDDQDDARYVRIARMGVDILGTDRPFEAFDALKAANYPTTSKTCGVAG